MRIIKKIKTLPLSHYTVRIGLLLLACLLVGCQSSAQTFALPASVISQPAGAAVHYRVIRKPFESLTEIKDEWIYLGRTPYEGKPDVSRLALRKHARLLLRLSMPGYNAAYKAYPSADIDLEQGLTMDASLKKFSIQAREEKLK